MSGLFITFEGPEGSGKTTQVELVGQALAAREPVMVREPGGNELGERIREIVLYGALELDAEAEMYLFMAARAELLETRIKPALAEGRVVIDDRYHDSTLAYQGGGRGVAAAWPAHFPKPDLTILLALPAQEGIGRHGRSGKSLDRLDAESLEFHEAVAKTYDRLAEREPERFLRLDATADPAEIHREVMRRVGQLL